MITHWRLHFGKMRAEYNFLYAVSKQIIYFFYFLLTYPGFISGPRIYSVIHSPFSYLYFCTS